MSENWAAVASEVASTVSDLGRSATLFAQPSGGPAAPHLAGAVVRDTTGTPIKYLPSTFKFSDGAYFKIETGDVAVLIPASYSPKVGDRISDTSGSFRIEELQKVNPNGTLLFYKAQLRKA